MLNLEQRAKTFTRRKSISWENLSNSTTNVFNLIFMRQSTTFLRYKLQTWPKTRHLSKNKSNITTSSSSNKSLSILKESHLRRSSIPRCTTCRETLAPRGQKLRALRRFLSLRFRGLKTSNRLRLMSLMVAPRS